MQYDDLIDTVAPVLGETGLARLKEKIVEKQWALERKSDSKTRTAANRTMANDGTGHRDYDLRRLRLALQEIADAEGDVDAYIAGYEEYVQTVPAIAAGIAMRLLDHGLSAGSGIIASVGGIGY